jgi:predicted N-acyltransferase
MTPRDCPDLGLPDGWTATVAGQVGELDEAAWDSLVPGTTGGFFTSHTWLRVVSAADGHGNTAVLVRDAAGRPAMGLLLGVSGHDCSLPYDLGRSFGAGEAATWRPQALLGGRTGKGNEPLLREPGLLGPWIHACRGLADAAGCRSAAIPYLTGDQARLARAEAPEARPVLAGARVAIDTGYPSFEDYLEGLRKSARTKVRGELRKLEAAGCVSRISELAGNTERLGPLFANVERRHGVDLPDDFFIDYLDHYVNGGLAAKSIVFERRVMGRTVAFSLAFEHHRNLIIHCVGLDYERIGNAGEYFAVLMHDPVRYAIAAGFDTVDLGATSYRAKLLRGGALVPLWSVLLQVPAGFDDARLRAEEATLVGRWRAEFGDVADVDAAVAVAQPAFS